VADATEYTEAGYYGKDVEVMIAELLHKCGQNVEEAQRGIVFIDEVDKIARRTHSARTGAGARDIGGEGVQQGLLKLLEGREIFVPQNVTQHWNKHDFTPVDTQDILFIAAGTFTDLRLYQENRTVGFGSTGSDDRRSPPITEKELLDYGLLAEFLGRLPVRVELDPLSKDDLFQILTVPIGFCGARVSGLAEAGRRGPALRGRGAARGGAVLLAAQDRRAHPARPGRGNLSRGDVRSARTAGRDHRDRRPDRL
jgi:ATP-dependent protease Clp ATPase subunit